MERWPLCRSERPAFLSSFLAMAIFDFLPRFYNKQVFSRKSEDIGVGYCEQCRLSFGCAAGECVRE